MAARNSRGAFAHAGLGLRHEARPAAKQQTPVRGQPKIMQKVPRIEHHPRAWAEFARQCFGERFSGDDVGTDRQQLRGTVTTTPVRCSRWWPPEPHPQPARPGWCDLPARSRRVRRSTRARSCSVAAGSTRRARQAGDILRRIDTGAELIHQAAVIRSEPISARRSARQTRRVAQENLRSSSSALRLKYSKCAGLPAKAKCPQRLK